MTDQYPPFSGVEATCVKCQHDTVSIEWQPAGTGLIGQRVVLMPGAEWFKRTCDRCGYVWAEHREGQVTP